MGATVLLMEDLALLMEDLALLMVDLALLMVDLALPFKPVLQVTSAARAMEIVKRIRIVDGDYFVEKIIAGENLDLSHLKEFPGKIRTTAALTISTFATRPKCSHHPGEPAALPLTPAHSAMETVTLMQTVNLVSCVGTTTAKTFIQELAIKMTAVHTEMMEVDRVEEVDQLPILGVRGTLVSDVARRSVRVPWEVETATKMIIAKGVLSVVQTTVENSTPTLIRKWTVVHTTNSNRQG